MRKVELGRTEKKPSQREDIELKVFEPQKLTTQLAVEIIPQDTLRLLFSFLCLEDLVACSQVNRKWRFAANTEFLWQQILFRTFPLEAAALQKNGTPIIFWKQKTSSIYQETYQRLSSKQKRLMSYCKTLDLQSILNFTQELDWTDLIVRDKEGKTPIFYVSQFLPENPLAKQILETLYWHVVIPAHKRTLKIFPVPLLSLAALCDMEDKIPGLLSQGYDPFDPSLPFNNSHPFKIAAEYGRTEILKQFFEAPTTYEVDKSFMLGIVCRFGLIELVTQLLQDGANVNDRHWSSGVTPLMVASDSGHTEVVSLLLRSGADPNAQEDMAGYSPLLFASKEGHADVVSQLIEARADTNLPSYRQETPLSIACRHAHVEVATRLLDAGANENHVINSFEGTLLQAAIRSGHAEMVSLLINAGADVNKTYRSEHPLDPIGAGLVELGLYNDDDTPLRLAVKTGQNKTVVQLIEAGADLTDLANLLSIAIKGGHFAIVKTLTPYALEQFIERMLSTPDPNGKTKFFGIFGAKPSPEICIQAASALFAFTKGLLSFAEVEKHLSVIQSQKELNCIYECFRKHPELIERKLDQLLSSANENDINNDNNQRRFS